MQKSDHRKWLCAALQGLVLSGAALANPQTLVINTNTSDIASKQSFAKIVQAFERENPDLVVEWNVFDLSVYNESFEKFINDAPPDVASGVSLNNLRRYASAGVLSAIDGLSDDPNYESLRYLSAASDTGQSQTYALPITVYPWGFLLRKDLVQAMQLAAPQNFDELLEFCQIGRENNVVPIALGTEFLWTGASWFDYLNLRINGAIFHREVVAGNVDFTDPRIATVFAMWRKLLDARCFSEDHQDLTWKEAFAQVRKAEAGMQLIGSFALGKLNDEQLVFAPFPMVTPGLAQTVVSPVDTMVVPKGAKNPEAALRFLRFMMQAPTQQILANARGQWPANRNANLADQSAARVSAAHLIYQADSHVQFFDREAPSHFAKAAMAGFREFLLSPDDLDVILQRIEAARLEAKRSTPRPRPR